MTARLVKRSISLSGHRTSVALEPEFWDALQSLSARDNMTLAGYIEKIDAERDPECPLASRLRVHTLLKARLLP